MSNSLPDEGTNKDKSEHGNNEDNVLLAELGVFSDVLADDIEDVENSKHGDEFPIRVDIRSVLLSHNTGENSEGLDVVEGEHKNEEFDLHENLEEARSRGVFSFVKKGFSLFIISNAISKLLIILRLDELGVGLIEGSLGEGNVGEQAGSHDESGKSKIEDDLEIASLIAVESEDRDGEKSVHDKTSKTSTSEVVTHVLSGEEGS